MVTGDGGGRQQRVTASVGEEQGMMASEMMVGVWCMTTKSCRDGEDFRWVGDDLKGIAAL